MTEIHEVPQPVEGMTRRELSFSPKMTLELVQKWLEIPDVTAIDPRNPEWRETPYHILDLTQHGLGIVIVKDESDLESNPTGTHKDRAAWEYAKWHRRFAAEIDDKIRHKKMSVAELENIDVPRLSVVTSGNQGYALSERFKKHGLPPIKILVSADTKEEDLQKMDSWWADIYLGNLGPKALTPEEILQLTNNLDGMEVTSGQAVERRRQLYDWHVHEAFNQFHQPGRNLHLEIPRLIAVPAGTFDLYFNYFFWQGHTVYNAEHGIRRDPRLKTHPKIVKAISLLAAEPIDPMSRAIMLTAPHKPFMLYRRSDIAHRVKSGDTGPLSDIYPFREDLLKDAVSIFESANISTEESAGPSALTSLMLLKEQDKLPANAQSLVVNTGRGLAGLTKAA